MEISTYSILWIKVLHIVAVISWMAGLLYLPRLFIYHCKSAKGSDKSETFKVMELRLLRAIMNPAMIITLLTGGLMTYSYGSSIHTEPWFVVKVSCFTILLVTHMYMGKWRKDFEMVINQKSQLFFRFMNEVPTCLMIIIIIMVVVKPF